jgi:hypothetical protein
MGPSLTLTCTRTDTSQQSGTMPQAVEAPAVVSLYLIPAVANPTNAASSSSSGQQTQPCLPVAHVMVVLLPPEPAAELSGWVAAQRLPVALVAAWGADLAVLVGCADQLATAAAAAAATAGRQLAPTAAAIDRLISMSRLVVGAAGKLRVFFQEEGLGAAEDLVAVLQQRVLVGATALQPMAAGHVVPAAAGAAAPAVAGAAAEGWVSSDMPTAIQVCVSATAQGCRTGTARHLAAASAPLSAPLAADVQPLTATGARRVGAGGGAAGISPSSSSSSSGSGACRGGDPVKGVSHDASLTAPLAAPVSAPNPAATAAGTSKAPGPAAPLHHLPQALAVLPSEAAALTTSWWEAVSVCWRGFRDAERSYQEFRAAFLWRWDLAARGCHFLVGVALTARALSQPVTMDALWGGAGLPGECAIAAPTTHACPGCFCGRCSVPQSPVTAL